MLTIDKHTSANTWRYSYNGIQFEKLTACNMLEREIIINSLINQFELQIEEAREIWDNRKTEKL